MDTCWWNAKESLCLAQDNRMREKSQPMRMVHAWTPSRVCAGQAFGLKAGCMTVIQKRHCNQRRRSPSETWFTI